MALVRLNVLPSGEALVNAEAIAFVTSAAHNLLLHFQASKTLEVPYNFDGLINVLAGRAADEGPHGFGFR